MCGIVGFINKDKDKYKWIKKMADAINHRGVNGEGYYVDDDIALGHKRLSIIDLENGSEPIYSEDKNIILIFNGEIYNFEKLKNELILKGHKFKTKSDAEVLLESFIEWGSDTPKHLRGMFAFAIYNKITKELFLVRDHFGIKPLYYYQKNNTFMFASEIKAFLEHKDFEKVFNEDILPIYLEFSFNPSNETFFKNVYELEPGTILKIKDGIIKKEKYFELDFEHDKLVNEDDVERVLKDSVKTHLQSDVPLASFLSSGVDSSFIVGLSRPDKTFTVGYFNSSLSEVNYAQNLCQELDIKNISKLISKEEYLYITSKVMYYLDEPLADASINSLYFLTKLASNDATVILSGEGADEFFGGYNTYKEINNFYKKVPFVIRNIIAKTLNILPEFKGRNFLVRNGLSIKENYLGVSPLFTKREVKKVLKRKDKFNTNLIVESILNNTKTNNDLEKMQAVDINLWLSKSILHKADRMSMVNSLELRVPFVDIEVFKIAKNLEINQKISNDNTKIILRKIAKSYIPEEVSNKKKLGFPVPLQDWLKTTFFKETIALAFTSDIANAYFDTKFLLKMLNFPEKYYKKIWGIYVFIKWYEEYFIKR